jgi:hypothetical protein
VTGASNARIRVSSILEFLLLYLCLQERTMKIQVRKIALPILTLLLATSVNAGNDNNQDNANNGNHYGQYKKVHTAPEPATLGLLAAGALAVGVSAWARRRGK